MNFANIRCNLMVSILAAVLVLPACLSGVSNLAHDDRVMIQFESPRRFSVSVSGIYQKGIHVEVSGRVWRHRLGPSGLYSGHVDVEIVDSDGMVTTTTGVPTSPRYIKRGLRHTARFSTQVEAQIENGAVLRLRFHREKHNGLL